MRKGWRAKKILNILILPLLQKSIFHLRTNHTCKKRKTPAPSVTNFVMCIAAPPLVFEDFYTDLFIAAQKIEIPLVVGSPITRLFPCTSKRPGEISPSQNVKPELIKNPSHTTWSLNMKIWVICPYNLHTKFM